jgi:hypothetical protein
MTLKQNEACKVSETPLSNFEKPGVTYGLLQFLQANAKLVPRIGQQLLPSTLLTLFFIPNTTPLESLKSKLKTA